MLGIIQAEGTTPQIQIAQETVIAIIVASTLVVLGLLWLIGHFASKAPTNEGPLHYGNFFVVIFGIMTVLIGFLIAFPLVISNVFTDPTQVIALLSALFGTIVGLVGTYFGVKSSSDASQKAQDLSEKAQDLANETTRRSIGRPGGAYPESARGTPNGAASETGPASAVVPPAEEPARRSTAAGTTMAPEQANPQGGQPGRDPSPPKDGERNR